MSLSLTYAGTVGNCSGMVIVTVCAGRDRGLTERLPYHRMKSISASRAGDGQTFSSLVMEGLPTTRELSHGGLDRHGEFAHFYG